MCQVSNLPNGWADGLVRGNPAGSSSPIESIPLAHEGGQWVRQWGPEQSWETDGEQKNS